MFNDELNASNEVTLVEKEPLSTLRAAISVAIEDDVEVKDPEISDPSCNELLTISCGTLVKFDQSDPLFAVILSANDPESDVNEPHE